MTAEPIEIELPDPWSARIHGIFDIPLKPIHDSALVTPNDDPLSGGRPPDGPLAEMEPLFGFN